jgi:hypothetical protein
MLHSCYHKPTQKRYCRCPNTSASRHSVYAICCCRSKTQILPNFQSTHQKKVHDPSTIQSIPGVKKKSPSRSTFFLRKYNVIVSSIMLARPLSSASSQKENHEDMKGDNEQSVKKVNAVLISQCACCCFVYDTNLFRCLDGPQPPPVQLVPLLSNKRT